MIWMMLCILPQYRKALHPASASPTWSLVALDTSSASAAFQAQGHSQGGSSGEVEGEVGLPVSDNLSRAIVFPTPSMDALKACALFHLKQTLHLVALPRCHSPLTYIPRGYCCTTTTTTTTTAHLLLLTSPYAVAALFSAPAAVPFAAAAPFSAATYFSLRPLLSLHPLISSQSPEPRLPPPALCHRSHSPYWLRTCLLTPRVSVSRVSLPQHSDPLRTFRSLQPVLPPFAI